MIIIMLFVAVSAVFKIDLIVWKSWKNFSDLGGSDCLK